jgi:predicted permease
MPARFAASAESAPGVLATPELWQPLQLSPKDPVYDGDNFQMIARMKPGVTLARVQAELNALREPFYQQYPSYRKWVADDQSLHDFRVWTLQEVLVGNVQRSLWTLMGAVIALLLVACLNLAGLVIARSLRRGREMAVRTALGATRGQLLRLLLCEGLLIAAGGGVLALAVSQAATGLLLHAAPIAIPALRSAPDMGLLGALVFGIALTSTVLFSLLPAWMILRAQGSGNGAGRLGSATAGETVSQARLSRALVVAQAAMAMLLVSTASVLAGTFVKLQAQPSGVEPKQLTVFQVTLKGDRYAKTLPTTQFVSAVLDELRRVPGVSGVTAIHGLPLDRGLNISGYPPAHPELGRTLQFRAVAPEYFKVMGIKQLAGRDLTASDRAETDPVVVIGETMAKRWWPGRSPVGEYLHVGVEKSWRIVGVAADVRNRSLLDTDGMLVYTPLSQLPDSFTALMNDYIPATFAVRTAAHVSLAGAAQRAVAKADPEMPIAKLTTMQAVIDETIREPRFFSLLAAGFSGFSMVLTVIGLFGLLSYQVTQRTREIGVRMALGADRAATLRGFLKRGLTLAVMGVVLGLGAMWMMRPVVAHLLTDAGVDAGAGAAHVVMSGAVSAAMAAVAMIGASIAASWLPARRAARLEPIQALRME